MGNSKSKVLIFACFCHYWLKARHPGRPKVNGEQVNKKIKTAEAVLEKTTNGFIFGLFLWGRRGGGVPAMKKSRSGEVRQQLQRGKVRRFTKDSNFLYCKSSFKKNDGNSKNWKVQVKKFKQCTLTLCYFLLFVIEQRHGTPGRPKVNWEQVIKK